MTKVRENWVWKKQAAGQLRSWDRLLLVEHRLQRVLISWDLRSQRPQILMKCWWWWWVIPTAEHARSWWLSWWYFCDGNHSQMSPPRPKTPVIKWGLRHSQPGNPNWDDNHHGVDVLDYDIKGSCKRNKNNWCHFCDSWLVGWLVGLLVGWGGSRVNRPQSLL